MKSAEAHQEAESLAAQADVARHEGRVADAAALYARASDCELQALETIPADRVKTIGIVSVSAVAYRYRAATSNQDAEAYASTIRLAHELLANSNLAEFAALQIDELLNDAQRELGALKHGVSLSRHGLAISLRGGSVANGIAQMDAVILKMRQLGNFLLRTAELLSGQPFRIRGGADERLVKRYTPMVSTPSKGSYHFDLRLGSSLQLSLFDQPDTPESDSVITFSFMLTQDVASGSFEYLETAVPDEQYRNALVQHVRAMIPDRKSVREMEITHIGARDEPSVILDKTIESEIVSYLKRHGHDVDGDRVETGVLRALHLDKGWIILKQGDKEIKAYTGNQLVLDDLVGPLVNQRVRVPGHMENRKGRTIFVVNSIDPDTDEEPE